MSLQPAKKALQNQEMFHNVATYILPVFGGIVGISGAFAYFKAGVSNSTQKQLFDAVRARDITISDNEKKLSARDATIVEKDNQLAEKDKHIAYLQKLAQGSPQLKAFGEKFDKMSLAIITAFKITLPEERKNGSKRRTAKR